MRTNAYFFTFCFIVVLNILSVNSQNDPKTYTPVVLWHGMGDTCCFPFSIGGIKKNIEKSLPGIHVVSLKIGKSIPADLENGYLMHPDKQIRLACNTVKSDPLLANGFNAVGFSQGSQFIRGLIQRCPEARVKNLITLGGQHQGVYGIPDCGSIPASGCDYIRKILNIAAYTRWVQKTLVQATYWHDPLNEEKYRKHSTFLSDINNELNINQNYKDKLSNLENFVMVKFVNDSVVEPVDSEWFGFYEPGQADKVMDLRSSDIYINDRLGLKELDKQGKLTFISTEGNHLEFSWPWFQTNILEPYLSN